METKYKGCMIITEHNNKTGNYDYEIQQKYAIIRTGWDFKTEQEALDKATTYIDQHFTPKRVKRFLK